MVYTNFVTIQDRTAVNPLWGGETVTLLATSINLNSGNIIASKPKTFQTTTQTDADTTAGDATGSYINNYNRRKSNVSYSGFNNQLMQVKCVYNPEIIGNNATLSDVSTKIFNPSKLMELVLKPRTIYIKDQILVGLLSTTQDGSPSIYNTYGIPVVLVSWNITPSLEGSEILMELSFREDKELS